MDVAHDIAFLTQGGTGLRPRNGWFSSKVGPTRYAVSYNFMNGPKPDTATWDVDLATKLVRPSNENGKILSWVPAE